MSDEAKSWTAEEFNIADNRPVLTVVGLNTPKPVGTWHIGMMSDGNGWRYSGVSFGMHYKPHWLHRFFTRLLLGWKWEGVK